VTSNNVNSVNRNNSLSPTGITIVSGLAAAIALLLIVFAAVSFRTHLRK
jgi:hypothetical protein